MTLFENVFFHPSPLGLWYQPFWICKKGKELFSQHHYDVMTVHDYPPFYNGIGARWLAERTRIPFALEVHHIVGYPKPEKLREIIARVLYCMPFFFRRTTERASRIRVVNHEVAEKLAAWGIAREKIIVVPSLYLNAAEPTPNPAISKRFDLVTSAWLAPHKGIAEILEALTLLPGVTLLIAGDGPERSKLEARARALGVQNRVEFRGWLPEQKDVFRTMQEGKIFIVNSRSEGNPRVAIEAMALGLPVVSTRVGIMPSFGENLITFTNGTPQSIAQTVKPLLENPSLREERGRKSREAILARFTPEKGIRAYAGFLHSLAPHP